MKISVSTLAILLTTTLVGCGSANKKTGKIVFTKNFTGKTTRQVKSVWNSCESNRKKWEKATWKDLMKNANTCAVKKKWKTVQEIGQLIIEREPDSPWGLYYLSLNAEAEGKNRKALWMVDMAIKKAPNSGTIHYHKSRLLWKEKEFELAILEMEKAIDLDPKLITAQLFLGQVKLRDQQYKVARKHFNQVLKSESSNYDALMGVADSTNRLNDYTAAIPFYEKAINQRPKAFEPRAQAAFIYDKYLQDHEKALKHYKWIKRKVSAKKVKNHLDINIAQKITSLEKMIVKKEEAQRKISSQTSKNKAVK